MATEKSENELLEQINETLDKVIGLVAVHGISEEREIGVLSGSISGSVSNPSSSVGWSASHLIRSIRAVTSL